MIKYNPQKDITTYELAKILEIFEYSHRYRHVLSSANSLLKMIQESNTERHFIFIEKEEKKG